MNRSINDPPFEGCMQVGMAGGRRGCSWFIQHHKPGWDLAGPQCETLKEKG